MTALQMGANAPLISDTVSIEISIPLGAAIDLTALMLYIDGKVRGVGDLCFANQTAIGGGAVRLREAGETRTFDIHLSLVPSDVEKIVINAVCETGAFGAAGGIEVRLTQGAGLAIDTSGRAEAALIVCEIYRRNEEWKIRNVFKVFNGGLQALVEPFGVEVGEGAPAPERASAADARPVSLSKVALTQTGESSRISLDKGPSVICVSATWVDNCDERDDNADRDRRARILMPGGSVHWLAASHKGSLDVASCARHMGDVTSASAHGSGTEVVSDISGKLGSPVGMVFSFYSAISNGAISIASLKPEMSITYQGREVTWAYRFPDGKDAKGVYPYMIGTVLFDGDHLDVGLSCLTSPKGNENTPWISRNGKGLGVSFDGSPVFKKGRTMMSRIVSADINTYANL